LVREMRIEETAGKSVLRVGEPGDAECLGVIYTRAWLETEDAIAGESRSRGRLASQTKKEIYGFHLNTSRFGRKRLANRDPDIKGRDLDADVATAVGQQMHGKITRNLRINLWLHDSFKRLMVA
jgi:hypothetical protein